MSGVKHEYVLDGTKILYEGWNGYNESLDRHNNFIVPLYDNEDSVCGIIFNAVPYFFLKNLQGDVIAITDRDGNVVARYTYDAWGKVTSITGTLTAIAEDNPYRYRGYYYDTEMGLYYLQSRYYDPETGRFINADDSEIIKFSHAPLSINLYGFCNNNSIDNFEVDGCFSLSGVFRSIKNIVRFSWGKISIKLSRTVSIVVGLLALIYRIFSIVSDVRSISKLLNKKMATAIVSTLTYAPIYVSAEIIAWACNVGAVVAILSGILSFFLSCCTGAVFTVAKTVLLFIVSYFAPTLIAAIQMLYYGFKKKKGCTYTLKLLGGSSVTF